VESEEKIGEAARLGLGGNRIALVRLVNGRRQRRKMQTRGRTANTSNRKKIRSGSAAPPMRRELRARESPEPSDMRRVARCGASSSRYTCRSPASALYGASPARRMRRVQTARSSPGEHTLLGLSDNEHECTVADRHAARQHSAFSLITCSKWGITVPTSRATACSGDAQDHPRPEIAVSGPRRLGADGHRVSCIACQRRREIASAGRECITDRGGVPALFQVSGSQIRLSSSINEPAFPSRPASPEPRRAA